jgi:hypothetical protein
VTRYAPFCHPPLELPDAEMQAPGGLVQVQRRALPSDGPKIGVPGRAGRCANDLGAWVSRRLRWTCVSAVWGQYAARGRRDFAEIAHEQFDRFLDEAKRLLSRGLPATGRRCCGRWTLDRVLLLALLVGTEPVLRALRGLTLTLGASLIAHDLRSSVLP